MSELTPFVFPETGQQIRVIGNVDTPLFHHSDVCKILQHTNPSVAARMLDDDESVMIDVRDVSAAQTALNFDFPVPETGNATARFVTEPGLYTLIFQSKAEGARPFRRWVTHEVLPAIRRTGRYETPGTTPREWTAAEIAAVTEKIKAFVACADSGIITRAEMKRRVLELAADIGLVDRPPTVEQERLDHAVRWMRRHYAVGEDFSLRDLHRALDGRWYIKNVYDAEAVADQLVDARHAARLPRRPGNGGRPPSPRFEVLEPPARLAVVPSTGVHR